MTWINSFADAFDIVRSEVLQFNLEISDEVGLDDESDYIHVEDDLCTVKCKLHNLIRKFTNNLNDISGASANQIKYESIAHHMLLEPITITEFGGNVIEWLLHSCI